MMCSLFFCFKQKTAYEIRISDWSSDVCSSDLLFDSLIRDYRLCNGLATAGHIDQKLLDNLNIRPEDRMRKILINMERLRWVPNAPGDYYLLANIPGFMLYAYEIGRAHV